MNSFIETFAIRKLAYIKLFQLYVIIPICFLLVFSVISVNSYAQTTVFDDTLLSKLFDRVKGSVVQITVSNKTHCLSASGFVFDKSGHIITNDHVVRNRSYNETDTNSTNNVTVTFLDDKSFKAKIIGSDPFSDLAVLQIENLTNQTLMPLPLSNSSNVKIGEHVIAIGNPFGLSGSMTEGIISGLGRVIPSQNPGSPEGPELPPDQQNALVPQTSFSIPEIIQTDAAINPGNSSPLLNLNGQIIGINSAIFSLTGEYSGVGFAIPSSTIQRVVPILISEHSYKHPWIGISGIDVDEQIASAMNLNTTKGFLVIETSPGGPASKAGIQGGDKLVDINGRKTKLGGDVIIKIDNQSVSKLMIC